MTTIYWPTPQRGQTRPHGYWAKQTQTGPGSTVIGVHSDVLKIGIQTKVIATAEYFIEGSMDSIADIESDNAAWFALYGDQTTAQTGHLQFPVDGPLTAIRLRVISGTVSLITDQRRA